MPILGFTAADALQTLTVEAGTYECIISEIKPPVPSRSGTSTHLYTTFRIIQDGKYKGKEKEVSFNSGTKSASLLGNMQFFPHSDFLVIDAAINNTKVEAVNKQINTDDLVNKPFAVTWGVATVEGKLENILTGFAPSGAGTAKVVF